MEDWQRQEEINRVKTGRMAAERRGGFIPKRACEENKGWERAPAFPSIIPPSCLKLSPLPLDPYIHPSAFFIPPSAPFPAPRLISSPAGGPIRLKVAAKTTYHLIKMHSHCCFSIKPDALLITILIIMDFNVKIPTVVQNVGLLTHFLFISLLFEVELFIARIFYEFYEAQITWL